MSHRPYPPVEGNADEDHHANITRALWPLAISWVRCFAVELITTRQKFRRYEDISGAPTKDVPVFFLEVRHKEVVHSAEVEQLFGGWRGG